MQKQLPNGFTLRAPTLNDAQAVTDLICLSDIAEFGEPDFSVDDLKIEWKREGFVLERDAIIVFSPDGTLVGYGNVWNTRGRIRLDPTTVVRPDYQERGIEEFFMAWGEEYAAKTTGVVQWVSNADNPKRVARLESHGYHPIRHDWVMEINLTESPPHPIVPADIVLRPFERGRDERAVWACIQEAFRDMWGHTEDFAFEGWCAWLMDHPDWRPEFSYLAQVGDEIVGATMTFLFFNGGWIRQLGVRRPWRKRGIGLALLYKIFGEFYARGVTRIGLAVDAESLTGATRLYERAGMRVKNHFSRYEKKIE